MGWYLMAIVDVLDWMPENHPDRESLISILRTLLDRLQEYDDPATGMWYQVLDCPGRESNYIESTCSAMFTYVYLKAAAKGYAPEYGKYARRLYRKLVKTFSREEADGTITLTDGKTSITFMIDEDSYIVGDLSKGDEIAFLLEE